MPVTIPEKEKPCIEIKDLNFSYNNNVVLENISFTVKTGEYLGVIGPNGGGKTTLIKIILGLLQPQSGTVKIFGTDINAFAEKALIGYVPQRVSQDIAQFPATVEEVVQSGRTARLGIFKQYGPPDALMIDNAMSIADVTHIRSKRIDELSGGERQRVFIARALAGEPKILILDEPSVGVDITAQERFYAFMEKLNHEYGLTILFVSHDIDVVAHEVKCLLCLNKHLVCHGAPREFMTEAYLEKLYGKKIKFVIHGH
ncbi:MAG TPA: zinc ABC transporter ATP-binding protein [Candidatus Magasanikbacteria bacterium]|nr:MAG: hypothetical protein A3I74_03590 [Candidatus Magasanikbacteria bacterium RIFCSPLOWO2_02_FULL_47_16]OGH80165.1 MAG: hypothetical protein A3C10_03175 [Candidatus Magasanikbacteria bacterium RIFCSPHIGHO2_02_FULL_48_18]HAZ28359.1 zinc ABC transporter ATP-binding protein [Candidatus Magasanikbacteria bacterium]